MAHMSLCLCATTGVPLGIGHLETYTRTGATWQKRKAARTTRRDKESRESERWLRGVSATRTPKLSARAIHVMDAEADFFELMRHMADESTRFIIRAGQIDRLVYDEGDARHLREVVADLVPIVHRDVALSERKQNFKTSGATGRRKHPHRSARVARVSIASTRITLGRTRYTKSGGADFEINVVRVWEQSPPAGEPAVEWVLLTSEPVAQKTDRERVVDLDRKRWTIEDYFKALKTGCSLERRQVESYDALCKVLAILAPIACQLLWLRSMDRLHSGAPASAVFTETELALLHQAPAARGLPKPKTVRDAVALLARLGGHIKNNGAPGWLTLGRGYEKLLLLRMGWQMALDSIRKCDQS